MTAVADLKHAHRAIWAAGDYAAVAERIDDVPPADLLAPVPVAPATRARRGHGNRQCRAPGRARGRAGGRPRPYARAARRRAAPGRGAGVGDRVDRGRRRGAPVRRRRASTRVLSVFGVQFAPRHQFAAASWRACAVRAGGSGWSTGRRTASSASCSRSSAATARRPGLRVAAAAVGQRRPHPPLFAGTGVELGSRSATTRGASPPRRSGRRSWRPTTAPPSRPASGSRPRAAGTSAGAEIVALAERLNEARDGTLLINAEYLVASGRKTV